MGIFNLGIFDLFSKKEKTEEIVKGEEDNLHSYLSEAISLLKPTEEALNDIIKNKPWPEDRERKVNLIRGKLLIGIDKLRKTNSELSKLKGRAQRIKEKRLRAGYARDYKLNPEEEKVVSVIAKDAELVTRTRSLLEVFHNIRVTSETASIKAASTSARVTPETACVNYLVSDYRRYKEEIAKTIAFLKSLRFDVDELLMMQGK